MFSNLTDYFDKHDALLKSQQIGGTHQKPEIRFTTKFSMYDPQVTGKFYEDFIHLSNLYNKHYLGTFLSSYLNKYEFIAPAHLTSYNNDEKFVKAKYDGRLMIKKSLLNTESPYISILKYQPTTNDFFHIYEILFNILGKSVGDTVLEIGAHTSVLDAFQFYYNKFGNPKQYSRLDMRYYSNFSNEYAAAKQQILRQILDEVNSTDYTEPIDDNFFNLPGKYDCICSNLLHKVQSGEPTLYIDHQSVHIQLATLIFIIEHLNDGGSAIIYLTQVRTKVYAEIVQLYQDNFGTVELYHPEVKDLFEHSGTYLVCKKFKKASINIRQLFVSSSDAEKMVIGNKQEYDAHQVTNSVFKTPGKYIESLGIAVNEDLFDKIRQYNDHQYTNKYLFMGRVLNFAKLTTEDRTKFLKKYKKTQLVDSMLYAQKYHLDYLSYGSELITEELNDKVVSDIYSYSRPIIFTFKSASLDDNPKLPKLIKRTAHLAPISHSDPFINRLHELERRIEFTYKLLDTRDIDKWDLARQTRFYTPANKQLHLLKYIQTKFNIGPGSQAWLKMYEMIHDLKLFKKMDSLRTFHLCEAPGNFISAINHYMRTMKPDAEFHWSAQSLEGGVKTSNSIALGDDYGYIKRHPDNWSFGDITDPNNTKKYQNLIGEVDFVTSDCGLGFEKNLNRLKIMVAEMVLILTGLTKGKGFLAKFMMPVYHPIQLSMIYTVYKSFDKCIIYKGVINQFSVEFYLVGKRFRGIGDNIRKLLEDILTRNIDKDYCLYNGQYDTGFKEQLLLAFGKLTNSYILNFDKQLFMVDNWEVLKDKNYENVIKGKNIEWVERMKLRRIDDEDRL
jgi:hypothetical protein